MFTHMPKYCVEFSLRTQTLLKFCLCGWQADAQRDEQWSFNSTANYGRARRKGTRERGLELALTSMASSREYTSLSLSNKHRTVAEKALCVSLSIRALTAERSEWLMAASKSALNWPKDVWYRGLISRMYWVVSKHTAALCAITRNVSLAFWMELVLLATRARLEKTKPFLTSTREY